MKYLAAGLLLTLAACEAMPEPREPAPRRPIPPAATPEPDYKPPDFPYFRDDEPFELGFEPYPAPALYLPTYVYWWGFWYPPHYGWWWRPYWRRHR